MIELIPPSYTSVLDLDEIFGRRAPLQVDLGCGDGTFIAAIARQNPDQNFLGIERLLGRVRSAAKKGANLSNMRILRLETSYAVRYLLPAGSVSVFHLLFPDPWPKRRHQRRRVATTDFLQSIAEKLIPDGRLHIATDQRDYFDQIQQRARETGLFLPNESKPVEAWPMTKFEKGFISAGAPIYRLELRKISPVT